MKYIDVFRDYLEQNQLDDCKYLLILGKQLEMNQEVIRESLVLINSQLLKPLYINLQHD